VAHQFRRETLATIRRRIGYLRHRDKFVYGTVLAVPSAASFTLTEAKTVQTGALKGGTAYVVAGTGSGQQNRVTGNTVGTGVCDVATSWAVAIDTTSVIEIWPENESPTVVNNAINEAINDAQDQAIVRDVDDNPTLDADRKIITPAATFTKVYAVTWVDSSGNWTRVRPVNYLDEFKLYDADQWRFAVQDGAVILSQAIPSDIAGASIRLGGYRIPNLLVLDTDQAEIRSDYLVYKAAVLLESGKIANPQLDPEGHAQRASVWLREVGRAYPGLNTELEPNTVDL
jgi:hypothetical protein